MHVMKLASEPHAVADFGQMPQRKQHAQACEETAGVSASASHSVSLEML